MNDPMKRKTSGSEKGRKTSFAGATPATTQATAPSSAVTGSGRASVTHNTTTPARITARLWASGVSVMGRCKNPPGERRLPRGMGWFLRPTEGQ